MADTSPGSEPKDGGAAIEAAHVTKVYGSAFSKQVKALDDLSLSVSAGQVFGLLGPNGAGKTTLIKIILDICRPTHGATFIFSENSRRSSARRRRQCPATSRGRSRPPRRSRTWFMEGRSA